MHHSSTEPLIHGTPAYKKARKAFMKSAQNRQTGDYHDWSPFRTAEKKYKAKFPPPDLRNVLDLALLDDQRDKEIEDGIWKGTSDALKTIPIRLKPGSVHADPSRGAQRAFLVEGIPGLVILPGFLSPERQRDLVRWSLAEHARSPNLTNLDAHYTLPEEGLWNSYSRLLSEVKDAADNHLGSIKPKRGRPKIDAELPRPLRSISSDPTCSSDCGDTTPRHSSSPGSPSHPGQATAAELLSKLRWANIGWFYDWGRKQYDFKLGKVEVGEPAKSMCKEIVQSLNWGEIFARVNAHPVERQSRTETDVDWTEWDNSYEPDAGIVNFYRCKDSMMGHVDRSEVCATSPLVSLSLGNAAVFLIGGLTREEKPVAILLRSGDAIVMAGSGCRRAYHGVPRILEGTLPWHLQPQADREDGWNVFGRYLQSRRINVNVRQVFPKGFKYVGSAQQTTQKQRDMMYTTDPSNNTGRT